MATWLLFSLCSDETNRLRKQRIWKIYNRNPDSELGGFLIFLQRKIGKGSSPSLSSLNFTDIYSPIVKNGACFGRYCVAVAGLFCWSRSRWKWAGSGLLLCNLGVLRWESWTILIILVKLYQLLHKLKEKYYGTLKKKNIFLYFSKLYFLCKFV